MIYSLGGAISLDKLAKDLNKLLSKIPQDELSRSALKISLVKITDYAGDCPLPKIEYKEQDSLT
jgi:hypothetical protein